MRKIVGVGIQNPIDQGFVGLAESSGERMRLNAISDSVDERRWLKEGPKTRISPVFRDFVERNVATGADNEETLQNIFDANNRLFKTICDEPGRKLLEALTGKSIMEYEWTRSAHDIYRGKIGDRYYIQVDGNTHVSDDGVTYRRVDVSDSGDPTVANEVEGSEITRGEIGELEGVGRVKRYTLGCGDIATLFLAESRVKGVPIKGIHVTSKKTLEDLLILLKEFHDSSGLSMSSPDFAEKFIHKFEANVGEEKKGRKRYMWNSHWYAQAKIRGDWVLLNPTCGGGGMSHARENLSCDEVKVGGIIDEKENTMCPYVITGIGVDEWHPSIYDGPAKSWRQYRENVVNFALKTYLKTKKC